MALYGAAGIWLAFIWHSWVMAVMGAVAALAGIAAAMLLRWSRYLVYALAAVFAWNFMHSIYVSARAGYFSTFPWPQLLLALSPEFVLLIIAVFCSVMAHRHFGDQSWVKAG